MRSTYGNVQIAFGANYRLGGKNDYGARRSDPAPREIQLDGQTVVDDGRIILEAIS